MNRIHNVSRLASRANVSAVSFTKSDSRCIKLLKLWDGFGLLAGHEPVDDKASDEGEEEEVQITEEGLLFCRLRGLEDLWLSVCHVYAQGCRDKGNTVGLHDSTSQCF